MNAFIKLFCFNISLLGAILIIAELVLQIIKPYDLYKRTYPNQFENFSFSENQQKVNWMQPDQELGWVSKKVKNIRFTNNLYNSDTIYYEINDNGFRSKFDFDNEKIGNYRVLFLGDSFLFGVYLNYKQTLIGNLEQLDSTITFFNLGIPGYGIDQMYFAYKKHKDIIKPDIIILVYIDDDINRVLESFRFVEGMNKPSLKLTSNEFEIRTNDSKNFWINLFESSYLLNKFYFKYLDYLSVSLSKKIFLEIKKDSKVPLIIVRWPRKELLYNRKIDFYYNFEDFFKQNHIYYVNLADEFNSQFKDNYLDFYLEKDGHPSEVGNNVVSKIIYNKLMKIKNNDL